ncbi:hypothetical protein [Streptomyces sp. NPDC054962]
MARNIGADGRTVYRAVITFTSRTGSTWTEHEGPYPKPGSARGRVTFWARWMKRSGGTATGSIEQAHTVWAPIGEQADPIAAARARGIREAADVIDNDDDCACGGCDTCQPRALAAHLRDLADQIHPITEEPTP